VRGWQKISTVSIYSLPGLLYDLAYYMTLETMNAELDDEIECLKDLAEVNDHVRPEEIAAMVERRTELAAAIAGARVRIDAVRLIWKAPAS
jgi:RNA polymerase recycling family C-terminal